MKKNKLVVIVSAIVIIVTGSILLGYKVGKSLKEDNIVTIVSKASYITMDDEVFDLQVTEKFQENINWDYIWVYSKTEKI